MPGRQELVGDGGYGSGVDGVNMSRFLRRGRRAQIYSHRSNFTSTASGPPSLWYYWIWIWQRLEAGRSLKMPGGKVCENEEVAGSGSVRVPS